MAAPSGPSQETSRLSAILKENTRRGDVRRAQIVETLNFKAKQQNAQAKEQELQQAAKLTQQQAEKDTAQAERQQGQAAAPAPSVQLPQGQAGGGGGAAPDFGISGLDVAASGGPQPAAKEARLRNQITESIAPGTGAQAGQTVTTREFESPGRRRGFIGPFSFDLPSRPFKDVETSTRLDTKLIDRTADQLARAQALNERGQPNDLQGLAASMQETFGQNPQALEAIKQATQQRSVEIRQERAELLPASIQNLQATLTTKEGRPIDTETATQIATLRYEGKFNEAGAITDGLFNTKVESQIAQSRTLKAEAAFGEGKLKSQMVEANLLANRREVKAQLLAQTDMATIALGPQVVAGHKNSFASERAGLPLGTGVLPIEQKLSELTNSAFGETVIENPGDYSQMLAVQLMAHGSMTMAIEGSRLDINEEPIDPRGFLAKLTSDAPLKEPLRTVTFNSGMIFELGTMFDADPGNVTGKRREFLVNQLTSTGLFESVTDMASAQSRLLQAGVPEADVTTIIRNAQKSGQGVLIPAHIGQQGSLQSERSQALVNLWRHNGQGPEWQADGIRKVLVQEDAAQRKRLLQEASGQRPEVQPPFGTEEAGRALARQAKKLLNNPPQLQTDIANTVRDIVTAPKDFTSALFTGFIKELELEDVTGGPTAVQAKGIVRAGRERARAGKAASEAETARQAAARQAVGERSRERLAEAEARSGRVQEALGRATAQGAEQFGPIGRPAVEAGLAQVFGEPQRRRLAGAEARSERVQEALASARAQNDARRVRALEALRGAGR